MTEATEPIAESSSFQHLGDVICPLTMELGSVTVTLAECLELKPRKVLRLDQPSGSDVTIKVGDVRLGLGEVVIVEDSTIVRVTDIGARPSRELVDEA